MADVSHRTVTEDEYDGSSGAKIASRTVHQLGVEIEGVFVPFLSKAGDYIDRLIADEKARQEATAATETAAQPSSQAQPSLSPAAQQVTDQAQQTGAGNATQSGDPTQGV